jgi:hypothetical protein
MFATLFKNFHPDLTQSIGLMSFALAFVATTWAAARTPRGARRTLWLWLAATHLLCWAEIFLEWRYRLHNAVNAVLKMMDWYVERQALQVVLIVLLLLLVSLIGLLFWRCQRGFTLIGSARVAMAGTLGGVLLLALEAISLHNIDTVMYTQVGPVLVIGWLWAAVCSLVIAAVWLQPSQFKKSISDGFQEHA